MCGMNYNLAKVVLGFVGNKVSVVATFDVVLYTECGCGCILIKLENQM